MKKLLLSLGCMLMLCLNLSAETACFHGSTKPSGFNAADYDATGEWSLKTGETYASVEISGLLKLEFTSARFDADLTRWYSGATMTLTPADGVTITKVSFKETNADPKNTSLISTNGTLTESGSKGNVQVSWTGNTSEAVKMKAAKQARFTHLTVEYSLPSSAVEKVAINSNLVGAEATVTLSCPTEGATIYYGFSQDAITNEYSTPFKVTESGIVYAFAQVGDDKSAVTQLAIDLPYTNFKDVIANANASGKEEVKIVGDFSVLFQSGAYLILTDGTSNILSYGSISERYEVGTKISAISASTGLRTKRFELSSTTLTEGGAGAEYVPVELTSFEGINYDDNLFDQVILKNCTISGKSGNNATVTINEENIILYNQFGLDFENGEGYEITGFVWRYNDDLEICPSSITGGSFVETVETPKIYPTNRELMPGDDITITCATEDVEIYYTIDGSEPDKESDNSTLYADAIDFPENVMDFTVKARAYYTGSGAEMLPSEIAERTYHIFDPTCNILTTDTHDVSQNDRYYAHTCTIDRVDYQMVGNHAGNNSSGHTGDIQMNNTASRFCYIIQTSDNKGWIVGDGIEYFLKSIDVAYDENPNNVSFIVRGSNTPFTADLSNMGDKGNIETNGDLIGTISSTNNSVEFTKNYRYFAFYPSKNGVVYIKNITVNYRSANDSPKQALTGAYLEADENTIQEQFEVFMGAYNADGNEIDFTGNMTISVTNAGGDKLEADEDFFYDVEGYIATVNIINAGVYTVTMSWEGDLNYEDGSLSTELTVFAPVLITDAAKGVTYSCNAETATASNGIHTFVFPTGARDHKISLEAPAGAQLHYHIAPVSVGAASAPHRAAASTDVPKGFRPHNGGELTLPGEHGYLQLLTVKNGVTSPVELAYYTNNLDLLDEVTTGAAEIEIDAATAVYYDLNGRRVEADQIKAGVYVRVAGDKVSKVLVK